MRIASGIYLRWENPYVQANIPGTHVTMLCDIKADPHIQQVHMESAVKFIVILATFGTRLICLWL